METDTKILVQALKFVLKMTKTEPIASLTTAVLTPSANSTDAELEEFVRQNLLGLYHSVGTCFSFPFVLSVMLR